ncbi:carbamoyltransferase HypF [Haloechinothrix salitolerans]|uniref:Carbamoyltransferase n=1 Tax=Haloechinothrix salitolerans TaxID=926830 RepID=A0ABW2C1B1_9PSEU
MRMAVRIDGVVQGVGFRPFVYGLATRLRLSGHVGNDASGVFAEVEGDAAATKEFLRAVTAEAPPLAVVEDVRSREIPPTGEAGFTIVASLAGDEASTLISADSATCDDCLREMADPADRRYRYPFINCTNCGPRFTIVRGVPYDRPLTTMADFVMCEACSAEYHDPADRRFHAQPVCCPACGPRLRLDLLTGGDTAGHGAQPGPRADIDDPLAAAARLLRDGHVLAVKGLGGFHLATDATHPTASATLRARKHREDKPFAVMVPDLAAARELCEVNDVDAELLTSRRRPIVLLPKRHGTPIADAVAPGNRRLGVLLPYTPLHHLLLAGVGRPIVLTSGNISDEPIVYRDEDVVDRLGAIAGAMLTHDRPIHIRTDDSVVRSFRRTAQVQRRSRGYVPEAVPLEFDVGRHILACGAELKNTFCVAKGRHAFLSHHIGDLENFETLRSFTQGIEHFRALFDVQPDVVAYDLHPEYLSTKYALDLSDVELVGVQHHHAHIASCLADNRERGPVLGVAFDGTGYGTDGTIWGGEFLLADLTSFRRLGLIDSVPMPGGAKAIKQPWRMAAAYLDRAYGDDVPDLGVVTRNAADWRAVRSMARSGVNAPSTSSAGRLFDAVAAVLGIRDAINYEGQAAIELEQVASPSERGAYEAAVMGDDPLRVSGVDLVRACVADLRAGVVPAVVAARFHNGVADVIARVCDRLRTSTGIGTVALSGGVFQNLLLLGATVDALEQRDFRVLIHSRVPTNDGGISLGQAVIAAHQRRAATGETTPVVAATSVSGSPLLLE